jgi:calcineurin-like phosphoesterase family protein
MAVYFIADMHFDDDNIRRYENRPFDTVQAMNEAIVANWNSTVEEDDEVYVAGDIGNVEYISRLKGKKYLIKGNHDILSNEEYRRAGFEECFDKPIIYEDFWMISHEPMYVSINTPYANIHGHTHNNPQIRTVSARSYCVCVERIDYTPISFEDIVLAVQEEDSKLTDD